MIKTLSPYYVDVPLVNPTTLDVCDSFVVKIYIWAGNKTAVPATPQYESTIINATASNGSHRINISRLINSEIEFDIFPSAITSLENSDNQVWIKFECYYSDQPTFAQLQFTELAVKGYGYFTDGENPETPTNKILLNIEDYKIGRNSLIVFPIVLDESTPPTPTLVIDNIVGDQIFFTTNIDFTEMFVRYSITTLNDWFIGFVDPGTASPMDWFPPVDPGTYDVQIFTYDPLTNTTIYSASFIIVIP